ncbi:hypothetical protein R3P38DRAFT_3135044 [Favolaschia claudopus]|uniref:Uncharacterized protein n=1 Tax=Favolaschia claudopus TaxID=2862362 RepID=A0AAV9Z782_9AGAR
MPDPKQQSGVVDDPANTIDLCESFFVVDCCCCFTRLSHSPRQLVAFARSPSPATSIQSLPLRSPRVHSSNSTPHSPPCVESPPYLSSNQLCLLFHRPLRLSTRKDLQFKSITSRIDCLLEPCREVSSGGRELVRLLTSESFLRADLPIPSNPNTREVYNLDCANQRSGFETVRLLTSEYSRCSTPRPVASPTPSTTESEGFQITWHIAAHQRHTLARPLASPTHQPSKSATRTPYKHKSAESLQAVNTAITHAHFDERAPL